MTSYKTVLVVSTLAICAILASACSDGPPEEKAFSGRRDSVATGIRQRDQAAEAEIDLGEDWEHKPTELARPGAAQAELAGGPSSYWAILLGTYTGEDHETAAANMVRSCATIDARLGAARVHTTGKGSMVIYGAWDDPQAPAAQAALQWIKGIQLRDRPVFPRAMLSRINVRHAARQFRPAELMSVRLRYPKLNPLYTLQVAVWGDFGSGQLTLEEIHRRAETYTRQLRARGYEAYFHHDDDRRLSMITVGLFDHTAIDPESGLYAPEVERLLDQFPEHLVNGEPLLEPASPRHPEAGQRVQTPKLVLVPEL